MARERDYELIMVVSPAVDEERVVTILERMRRLIVDRGGTITKEEPWGIRRLAYPIKDFKEGNYFLTQFKLETGYVNALNFALQTSEDILRHLVVKLDEKAKIQA